MVSAPRCRPGARGLLALLLLLLLPLPGARGQCGALPGLIRASHNDTSHTEGFPIGAQVTYRCLDGFVKIPGKSDTVVCLENSEWSNLGEFCNAILCPPPYVITNGFHTGQSEQEFSFGSVVTYKCDQGFSVIGEASIHCTTKDNINGEWSEPVPECKAILCPPPYVITNGFHTGQSEQEFSFGSAVTYKCDQGFSVIGEASIHCTTKDNINGEWSEPVPECKAISCRPPPDITHGSHISQTEQEFAFGSAVTYKCDQGFSLIGEASIHCRTKDNLNGEWSGPAPECKEPGFDTRIGIPGIAIAAIAIAAAIGATAKVESHQRIDEMMD
ncbi:hypothetical protein KIL84_008024 [Mauremys mutica]|uniref:Sushi domain-containing protein n=1 Tax=Mauremys mutica TaxID=74926 RepID=A0A9D3X3W5_9SAUR|nr:hypothetical protein KIL84_008024 [Mauremys mutica]